VSFGWLYMNIGINLQGNNLCESFFAFVYCNINYRILYLLVDCCILPGIKTVFSSILSFFKVERTHRTDEGPGNNGVARI